MKNSNNNLNPSDDQQNDLKALGIKDPIPYEEEYYTLDLKRGLDDDLNDTPAIDLVTDDPYDENTDDDNLLNAHILKQTNYSTSSNAGGLVDDEDSIDQNTVSGVVPGEPGHWGIDEGTD